MLSKENRPIATQKSTEKFISAKQFSQLDENERQKWLPIKEKHEKVPLFCKISWAIAAVSLILYIIACINEDFADFYNLHVSSIFRFLLAKISNIFPFSLAELFVILIPVITFLAIWYILKHRCESAKSARMVSICIISTVALVLSAFSTCFAIGYKGTSLDKKLGLEAEPIGKNELRETADYLAGKLNELAPLISYGEDSFSTMPYDLDELNRKLLDAYDSFCAEQSFIKNFKSRLKPVMLSEAMSYSHITGVYTFFTGESNINVGFPDYTIPYTAAHELAHQRGVAREDEANMVAFLVCLESDDPYIQYSAYLNVYEYVANALYSADKKSYSEINKKLDSCIMEEEYAYSEFFKKYSKSVSSQVTGVVNDVYLKAQGTVGKRSYGMVVDLTVSYLKSQDLILK